MLEIPDLSQVRVKLNYGLLASFWFCCSDLVCLIDLPWTLGTAWPQTFRLVSPPGPGWMFGLTTSFRILIGIPQNSELCQVLQPIRTEPHPDVPFITIKKFV